MTAELLRRDALWLAQQIRTGALDPVDLVQASLDRIQAVNPAVNAMCTVAEDALGQARAARAACQTRERATLGCLHGVPVGIKDVTPTANLRTTYGSALFADHVPTRDAAVVARLKTAGAIVLGKTNTPEFATGGHTDNAVFGPTRNPWDLQRTAGGSTGGGAAALACGMIALAEGTDLGGSLRIPAAFCGLVGLRPTPGLVPTAPTPLFWDHLQVNGPMARSVVDVALMLQAMADPKSVSPSMSSALAPSSSSQTISPAPLQRPVAGRDFVAAAQRGLPPGLRVGFCEDLSGRGIEVALVDPARRAMRRLAEDGAVIEDISLDLSDGHEAFRVLRGLWMVGRHGDLLDRIDKLGDNLAGNLQLGLALTPQEIAAAQRTQSRIWHTMQTVLQRVDVLITPTVAVPPFPLVQGPPMQLCGQPMQTYIDWVAPTYLLSLTSLPVLAVPCGQDANGMPVGLQVVGPTDGEELILAVGAAVAARSGVGLPVVNPVSD